MKKFLLSLLIAVAAVPASAQFKYGVEAGLNLNYVNFSGGVSSDMQAGFFIGPKVQLTVPLVGLTVDGAIEYSQMKFKIDDANYGDESETMSYIVVPINLRYGIGLGSIASVYAATGPQYNWNVNDLDGFKSHTLNWNFGVGVSLLTHYQIGATYSMPVTKSGDDSARIQLFQVRFAYMF